MLFSESRYIGHATNNIAEYTAILEATKKAVSFNPEKVIFKTDSELIARQFSGIYKIKDENLKRLHMEIRNILKDIPFSVEHIRREENKLADKLSKEAVKKGVKV